MIKKKRNHCDKKNFFFFTKRKTLNKYKNTKKET